MRAAGDGRAVGAEPVRADAGERVRAIAGEPVRVLIARYLAPVAAAPRTRAVAVRAVGALRACIRGGDVAGAYPASLTIDLGPGDAGAARFERGDGAVAGSTADGARGWTAEAVAALVREAAPLRVVLVGRGALANPELPAMIAQASAAGTVVELVTDGLELDAGRAYALIAAGLARLTVTLREETEPRALRSVEKLVAMRDANRKPGPVVTLRVADPGRLGALIEVCHARFEGIEPEIRVEAGAGPAAVAHVPGARGTADTAARVAALRAARVQATRHGFRGTVASIDTALAQLQRAPGSPCYLPWYAAFVGADGELHPCSRHAGLGPVRGAGQAARAGADAPPDAGTPSAGALASAWDGAAMRAFRARLREDRDGDAICAACPREDARLAQVLAAVGASAGRGR